MNDSDSYLVDYAIEHYGAEVIGSIEEPKKTRPPFPCLTGVSNTSSSFKIDKNLHPNIVAAGVDTLELNFGISEYRQPDEFKILDDAKSEAVYAGYKGHSGVSVDWYGQKFMVQSHGSNGGYKYIIKNVDIDIQLMPEARGGKPSPELRVVFRSPFLWQMGEVDAYNQVIEFLNNFAYIEYCKVSRADLCVDMVMSLPEINRKTQVVTLFREKSVFYGGDFQRGQRNTGYQFGRGVIACRLYDKTYDIEVKGQGHIMPLWMANGWDGKTPVSRFELQLRREGLRRFDTTMDFLSFQACKPDIWAYGTEKYIRIVEAGSATRKERAKVAEYWKDYQDCYGLFGERRGILPFKQQCRDWELNVKQAHGCLANAWAKLAVDVGDNKATLYLETEWGRKLPESVIEAGLKLKSKYAHLS